MKDSAESRYPSLVGRIKADVAVVGAGITGLTTAFLLKRAGAKVAVVEAAGVCSGTSGNTTAKITSLHRLIYARVEAAFGEERAKTFADANQAAIKEIETIAKELNIDCHFHRLPAYTFTRSPSMVADMEAETRSAQKAGLPARFVREIDLPLRIEAAVRVDDQARFHPYRYCSGIAKAIDGDGCLVFEFSRAVDVKGRIVKTENGEIEADHIVLATQLPFLDQAGTFAWNYPSRSYLAAIRIDGEMPQGMYISAESPTRTISRAAGSDYLLVGGESHKTGHDPDTYRRYDAIRQWAGRHFSVRSVDFEWSSQDFMPADGLPYIGRLHPLAVNVYTATGFAKWGITRGTFSGMILRDTIMNIKNPWAEAFSSTRMNPSRSAKTFFLENFDVGKRFVFDRMSAIASKRPEDLPSGAGEVVRAKEGRAAAYRDENGVLHSVSPVCTHLGCYVTWNPAEKSWDCPCHGSRYDVDGNVLSGPTVSKLPEKKT